MPAHVTHTVGANALDQSDLSRVRHKHGQNGHTMAPTNRVVSPFRRHGSRVLVFSSHNQVTPQANSHTPQVRHAWRQKARRTFINALCNNRLQLEFDDVTLEEFYQVYAGKQKAVHFVSILVFNLCFASILIVLTAANYSDSRIPFLVIAATSLIISLCSLLAYKKSFITGTSLTALSYLLWLLLLIQILVKIFGDGHPSHHNSGDTTSWLLLLSFFTYVVLPARRYVCMLLSLAIDIVHLTLILIHCTVTDNCDRHYVYVNQVIGNITLYVSVNALGYLTAYLSEKGQRKAFLEIKEAILANAYIEEQLLDQEELLTSVLPRHVASSMMADSMVKCTSADDRFRKMYMTRHENVSILFADIVGFTTMSSIKDASDVCSLLNELFTAFDDLAETVDTDYLLQKYHQLRIKILGDCYYCISGAPQQRPDHAVLCIHMGLGMVQAIRAIRERNQCDVDMRVGIHCGKVMGGVIGQRQWQYDVMSEEVNIANQMESYGIPGQVHVSERVLENLDGEFLLERRERLDGSLISNMNTYLVREVLKKYPAGTLDENDDVQSLDSFNEGVNHTRRRQRSSLFDHENHLNSTLYREMMKQEGEGLPDLGHTRSCLLVFNDPKLEAIYRRRENRQGGISTLAMDFVLLINLSISSALYPIPESGLTVIPYVAAILSIIPIRLLTLGNLIVSKYSIHHRLSRFLQSTSNNRHILTVVSTLIAYTALATVFYMYQYNSQLEVITPTSLSSVNGTMRSTDNMTRCLTLNCTLHAETSSHDFNHTHPEFFQTGITLALIATHLLSHVGYITQAFFMLLMSFVCSVFIMWTYIIGGSEAIFRSPDDFYNHACSVTSLCGAAVVLTCLSYQKDRVGRKLFLSRIESDNQRERINSLKAINQKLVHNILPPYIATHFLQSRNNRTYFSESYDDVGVMFIAIPQFRTFYSEENYNNDGLECIRFLNEIISDFDEIVSKERFVNITKIKTVGSTYMVASGMDSKKNESLPHDDLGSEFSRDINQNRSSGSAPSTVRVQQNLLLLIDFCMALRDQMDSINEQAFNTFMLRAGVNHGPVVGGVIGARKPHFDIWGNTVNVASRMESTGMDGKIQCTKEAMDLITTVSSYVCERRGCIHVKGKGELDTYLLDCSPQAENSYLWT